MTDVLITKELNDSSLNFPKGIVLDARNVEKCVDKLKGLDKQKITVYDLMQNPKLPNNSTFAVKDHINCSGSNPLVGRQSFLGVDFVDMSNVYRASDYGIVTHSCGEAYNLEYEFPSGFLAHIIILCRAMKFQKINAILINLNCSKV